MGRVQYDSLNEDTKVKKEGRHVRGSLREGQGISFSAGRRANLRLGLHQKQAKWHSILRENYLGGLRVGRSSFHEGTERFIASLTRKKKRCCDRKKTLHVAETDNLRHRTIDTARSRLQAERQLDSWLRPCCVC